HFELYVWPEGLELDEALKRRGGSRATVVRDDGAFDGPVVALHNQRRGHRFLDDPGEGVRRVLRTAVEEMGIVPDDEQVVVFHVLDDPFEGYAFLDFGAEPNAAVSHVRFELLDEFAGLPARLLRQVLAELLGIVHAPDTPAPASGFDAAHVDHGEARDDGVVS